MKSTSEDLINSEYEGEINKLAKFRTNSQNKVIKSTKTAENKLKEASQKPLVTIS